MKKKFLFMLMAIVAIFAMPSCDDSHDLDAYFTTEYDEYEVGEVIYFENQSSHAESYYWEFDDGYFSDRANPEHYYTEPGTYTIWLTVYCDDESDDFKKVIRIYPKSINETQPESQE